MQTSDTQKIDTVTAHLNAVATAAPHPLELGWGLTDFTTALDLLAQRETGRIA
ncbi:hypothetical protein IWX78_001405 [Mycetocola sp. CAN_C7]|uniref:hypothetical protein n=1 Tax=Mycetocola sp. CAN_C7 TaxID=2787724 RepID=UPI0018C8E19B